MMKSESYHSAEYDCDTLMRAEEIKRDPDRHSRAKEHARTKVKAIRKIAGGKGSNSGEATFAQGYVKLG